MLTEERALPSPDARLGETRARLAAEWQSAAPRTAEDIARFYSESRTLRDDLEAWHSHPERQEWTRMLVHVAKDIDAKLVIDIGAGAGHDLRALANALGAIHLWGVEPNYTLHRLFADIAIDAPSVDRVPIDRADMLICIDVLEHVVDPETFLGGIASRAKEGCVLVEATATHDVGTPLHLKDNWGWHPGRVLERHGWELVDYSGRLRVWKRLAAEGRPRAALLLCAYRSVNAETLTAVLAVCAGNEVGYRLRVKTGDALISRSRSVLLTAWYRECNDDVALMFDDDISFTAREADHLVELCRNGHDIIAGAYPVRNGGHLALRGLTGGAEITFGLEQSPVEIQYAATGFVAIHRRVLDTLIADMPLCHATEPWSFYPLFPAYAVPNETAGGWEWLSEDYGFCDMARKAGYKVWLDPSILLKHASSVQISVRNMSEVYQAIGKV